MLVNVGEFQWLVGNAIECYCYRVLKGLLYAEVSHEYEETVE